MSAGAGKRKRVYFYPSMDIRLILEVLHQNPYRRGNAVFGTIVDKLTEREEFRGVERRTLQDRTERLLKIFRSKQLQCVRRSGTDEEYNERERLLQELSDLEKEWVTRKRQATPTATEFRKKAARLHSVSVLRQQATTTAECEPAEAVEPLDGRREEGAVFKNEVLPATAIEEQEDLQDADQPQNTRPPNSRVKRSVSLATRWSSTLDCTCKKMDKEEENKKNALEIQKEELKLKKEEIEVRKLEAENERLRIETQQREQLRRAELEEERRKDEREEKKQMLDRQNKLMDAMLRIIQNK